MTTLPAVSTVTPSNRGNLRLKSLSLRELEDTLSLAVDFTVTNQRLQLTSSLDDGTSVNMFSVIGSTSEMTTLSVSTILAENISTSGTLFLDELSVNGLISDLSVGGSIYAPYISVQVADVGTMNVFAPDTLSVGGNVVFAGGTFQVAGDDGGFEVARSLSCGAGILGQSLVLGDSANVAGSLSVGGITAFTSSTSIGGRLDVASDTEVAGSLSVSGLNTTLDTDLSVSGELAVRQDAVFDQALSVEGNLTTSNRLSVGGAVRLSSILNVMSISTFHGSMSVHGPFDVEGTVTIGEGITADTLSVQGLSTLGTLSVGLATLNNLQVRQNLSVAGDLIVEGNTITLNTSQVDIEDPIIEIGTGGESLAGIKIVKDTVAANNQSGIFREKASDDGTTPSFFAVYEDFNDTDSLNIIKTVGDFRVAQLSTSSGAFLGGTLSVGGRVDVSNVYVQENLSLSGFVHAEGDISIGGSANMEGSLEMNGAVSTGSDMTSGGNLSVQGSTDIVGITQIASKLSVTESVTFASDLSVGTDLHVDAKMRLNETLSTGGFAVVNGSLSVSGTLVLDDDISVSGNGIIGQSLSVSDVAVMTPSSGSNTFTVNAESASLITLTADNTDVIHRIEFDEPPVRVTAKQDGKLDIVYTEIGTVTGPAILYDATIEKWVLPLQYVNGTVNPVQVPSSYVIETDRPYVSKNAFKIFNLLTNAYIHDTLDLTPKDIFTSDSGSIIPTVSVSGDIVSGAALSVGHDIHCHGNTLFSNTNKRVGIKGKLSVHDDVNLNQRVIIGGRSDAFLSIGSDIAARQSLSVGGKTVLTDEMSVGQFAFFNENVDIKGSLSVQSVTVGGTTVLNNSLSVAELIVLNDDLSVAFNQVVGVDLSVGARVTTQGLSVSELFADSQSIENATLGSLTNTGDSDLQGKVEIGSTLSVASGVYHGSSLSVGDRTDFAGNVFIDGKLSVTDASTLEGATLVNNTLDVTGVTKLDDTLSVTGAAILSSFMSVGGFVELSSTLYARDTSVVNKQLSVGRQMTVSRQLSVADNITGGRNISVGGFVLDRTRTKTRYYLLNQQSNGGLQIQTTSAGEEFIFDLADGRLYSVTSFQQGSEFFVRSPLNVSVNWIEVNSTVEQSDFVDVRDLVTDAVLSIDFGAPGSSATAPIPAGLTALSVAHNMTIGKDGEDTFLSVGSTLDVTGRTQIGNSLSVSGAVYLANSLSTSGDVDVASNERVGGSLSVGTLGIFGSTLSVQGDTTISSKLSVQGDLDVSNEVRFANHLSVNGDLDIGSNSRLYGSLSVQGLTTIDDDLSVSGHLEVVGGLTFGSHLSTGGSAVIGDYLSVENFVAINGYLEVGEHLSVGQDLALVGAAEMNSTLSVNGSTFIGDSLEVESHASVGGTMDVSGDVRFGLSTGTLMTIAGQTSVGGAVTGAQSLSVASLIASPATGENSFTLSQPITSSIGAVKLRIELAYPHTLELDTNSGFVGQSAAVQTANNTFVTELDNPAGITDSIGQINGFRLVYAQNSSVPQLRYMTEQEVLKVEYELGNEDVTVLHDVDTNGLTGGKRAPTLSVGGRIVLLEDLSVGFDATVSGMLSVNTFMVADTLSVSKAFTTSISTSTLYVANSDFDEIISQKISVQNAFIDFAQVKDHLSIGSDALFTQDILVTGQNLTLENNLSLGGDAQMNLISVANLHVNMLSVSDAYASELSVHTLFVQQVSTTDPDDSFDFQDDAHFQGDLTIEGKLFVKDILFTGPGGQFTIENIAGLTVSGNISTANLFLDITNAPSTSTDPGTAGLFAVDTQYIYVCVTDNLWRRIAMSAF